MGKHIHNWQPIDIVNKDGDTLFAVGIGNNYIRFVCLCGESLLVEEGKSTNE